MKPVEMIVVGASLGGFEALGVVLAAVPTLFPVPIAIAQHRSTGGDGALSRSLSRRCGRTVVEPDHATVIAPGEIYLAPADYHMLVDKGRLTLSTEPKVRFARPSIDVLFESAADAYGPSVLAIALTSSSDDGAAGAARVAENGGRVWVQDPMTAVSPVLSEAIRRTVPRARVLALEDIARGITSVPHHDGTT